LLGVKAVELPNDDACIPYGVTNEQLKLVAIIERSSWDFCNARPYADNRCDKERWACK